MKKSVFVSVLFILLVVLSLFSIGCSTQIKRTLEEMPPAQEVAPTEAKEKSSTTASTEADSGFNLPADPDTLGWMQTAAPLGGTVIRMVPYQGGFFLSGCTV